MRDSGRKWCVRKQTRHGQFENTFSTPLDSDGVTICITAAASNCPSTHPFLWATVREAVAAGRQGGQGWQRHLKY